MSMLEWRACLRSVRRLVIEKHGSAATEYVFLIAFLAIAVAFGAVIYGQALIDFFDALAQALEAQPATLPPGS